MKSLIVFYSRSNITRKLAESIQKELECDIEEIEPKVNYKGKLGYARGIKDGASGKIVELNDLKYNPQDYDTVYLGAPVWASKAANPIISYISQNKGKFSNVKFFATAGSSGFESTFRQMEENVGIKPQKTLALTTKEVKSDEFNDKMISFIN